MRYYIIFGITFIISALLIFYPKKYLSVYENKVTIDYSTIENTDDNLWTYEISGDSILLLNHDNKKWTFNINKNGITKITFYYDKNSENQKYKIEYKFRVRNKKIYWLSGEGSGMFDFPNPI